MERNTVQQLTPAVGAIVGVRFDEMEVFCHVVDAKNSYGRVRLLVTPELGNGSQWIELSRVMRTVRVPDTRPEWVKQELARTEGK